MNNKVPTPGSTSYISTDPGDMSNALARMTKLGKHLNVVFILALILCIVALLSPFGVWAANQLGLSTYQLEPATMWPTLLFNAIQFTLYIVVFALCLSVSRYTSRGNSPFTTRMAKRINIGAVLLLVFFVLCLLWNPIFNAIDPVATYWYTATGTYEAFAAPFINFPALIISLVLYLLAHILQYGEVLQELSDDTV